MLSMKSFTRACTVASPKHTAKICLTSSRLRTCSRKNSNVVAYKEDDKLRNVQEKAKQSLNQVQKGAQDALNGTPADPSNAKQAFQELQKLNTEDDPAVKLPLFVPGFTRRREIWVGRWAMVGFFAAVLGEIYTHGLGPIGQVVYWTGLSEGSVKAILSAVLLFSLAGTVSPATYSEENQRDVAKRLPEANNPRSNIDQSFGFGKGFGFVKANELFSGRMAMLGFLAAVIGEGVYGTGPIGQVAHYLGVNPDYGIVGQGVTVSVFAAIIVAYLNGNYGQVTGDEDLY